ncbi:MAG TPA: phosphoribosyl-ATP diphosphatase [Gemmatimonadaceae bacterium]|nr:phosphoribosyl-ATP diphosphatase [Gemmatimonadaceae bacterium]
MSAPVAFDVSRLNFAPGGGFVTVVTQDARTGCVLMTARADREAVMRILASGEMHYHSRTRGLWHKGATSGNRQRVVTLETDCDGDALLARVVPLGPACHSGRHSCFGSTVSRGHELLALATLDEAIAARAARRAAPDDVPRQEASDLSTAGYTQRLLRDRNLRLKKLGEEAAELAVACADGDAERACAEGADLLYHMLVALRAMGVGLADLASVLAERRRARSAP